MYRLAGIGQEGHRKSVGEAWAVSVLPSASIPGAIEQADEESALHSFELSPTSKDASVMHVTAITLLLRILCRVSTCTVGAQFGPKTI